MVEQNSLIRSDSVFCRTVIVAWTKQEASLDAKDHATSPGRIAGVVIGSPVFGFSEDTQGRSAARPVPDRFLFDVLFVPALHGNLLQRKAPFRPDRC
jgi:hypothetical protein